MVIKHTITDDILTKQLIWFGHTQRMDEQRIPRQILKWEPEGKKERGRTRTDWREEIDREIEKEI